MDSNIVFNLLTIKTGAIGYVSLPSEVQASSIESMQHDCISIRVVLRRLTHEQDTLLQRVEQLMDEWDSARSEEFVTKHIQIGIELQLAKEAFARVTVMAEQLIRSPPPYDQNPDEQRYRRIELLVLCGKARTLSENLLEFVKDMKPLVQQSSAYSLAQGLVMVHIVQQEADGNVQNASKLTSMTDSVTGAINGSITTPSEST